MQSEFGDALARRASTRWCGCITGTLFSGASVEAGVRQEKAACPPSAQRTDGTGLSNQSLTTPRIAEMVEREFGVRYHPDHIGCLMHSLGWTPQKPERRALERNEEEIERWKQEEWPRIKKTLQGWVPISSSPTNRAFPSDSQCGQN